MLLRLRSETDGPAEERLPIRWIQGERGPFPVRPARVVRVETGLRLQEKLPLRLVQDAPANGDISG